MKYRFIGIVLTIAILLSCMPLAGASEQAAYMDIAGHSAETEIQWAADSGLFIPGEDGMFYPDKPITRAVLTTVLGRLAEVDPAAYSCWYTGLLYEDVPENSYYAPYALWATQVGIITGTADYRFNPKGTVTREQLAVILMRYASDNNLQLRGIADAVPAFSDAGAISAYAVDAVEAFRTTGLFRGSVNEAGAYRLFPKQTVSRGEFVQLLFRFCTAIQPYNGREIVPETEVTISQSEAELWVNQRLRLGAEVFPEDTTNKTLTWISSDPTVAKVNRNGVVTAVGEGTAEVFCLTVNGLYQTCTVNCTFNQSLASGNETYADKCMRLFGTVVTDPRNYYKDDQEAASHMVNIPVRVWDFTDDTRTEKTTKILWLQVHENLAVTYQAIFEEIYNGEEQFPIREIGCYRGEADSEHFSGCAVDINPNENYECMADGTPLTGSYWKPGEDEYSIPLNGDVANAFAHYGFTQGVNWKYTRDYMHFSYFAT